jgi:hypothetical protein
VKALLALYPEHTWHEWMFSRVPDGFWNSIENQRRYLDWLAPQLKFVKPPETIIRPLKFSLAYHSLSKFPLENSVSKLEDWYQVSLQQFETIAGESLLRSNYSSSLVQLLTTVYPEHKWHIWKFTSAPRNLWASIDVQRLFFESLKPALNVRTLEDWYSVTGLAVTKLGGEFLRDHYGMSIEKALRAIYPEHTWESWRFPKTSSSVKKSSLYAFP